MQSGAEPGEWTLEVFSGVEALPDACEALFAAQTGFQSSRVWYRTVIQAALPDGAAACLVLCRRAAQPYALFPMQIGRHGTLQSLTTPYTVLYQPLVAAGVSDDDLRQAGRILGRFCRRWATVRIDGLEATWPGLPPLLAGLRRAGLLALRFDHFGNWHVAVEGLDWVAYLAGRPGALRETVRRKLRRAESDGRTSFEVFSAPEAVAASVGAYEDVYGRSWKEAEPFADFNPTLMRAAAGFGVVRLGVLRHAGRPVAVQFWIVDRGRATVLKLAHDEAFRSLSPGTVLTAMMIRGLLDQEHVAELDFGRGDDPYKQLWTDRRRQRVGVVLVNPLRPAGVAAFGRHLFGKLRRAMRKGPNG